MEEVINLISHHFSKIIFLMLTAAAIAVIVFFVSRDIFLAKKKTAATFAKLSFVACIVAFFTTGIWFR